MSGVLGRESHTGFLFLFFDGVGSVQGGCCMLKNKIRLPEGSWQELSLRARSSEGLFIKSARHVRLGGGSFLPGHGRPGALGRHGQDSRTPGLGSQH